MLLKLTNTKSKGIERRLKTVVYTVVKLLAMPLAAIGIYAFISFFENRHLSVISIAPVIFIVLLAALALSNKTGNNNLS